MSECRVAVIGAGAAGLTAAYQLKKCGYQRTTVFEKDNRVGGKVCTFYHEGRPYEIGAVWTTSDYRTIDKLCAEFNVPRYPASQMDLMTTDGKVERLISHVIKNNNVVSVALDLFRFWNTCRRNPRLRQPGFHGPHPDFHLPLDQLSHKYGFPITAQAMAPTMSACGYGFSEEIPAQYWMKLMMMLLHFAARGGETLRNLKCFNNGYQSLWQAVADELDVRVGTPVSALSRTAGDSGARVEITTEEGTQVFDRVIVTAPLETAHKFMDLSDSERELFNKILTLRYIVTVATVDTKVHVAFSKNIKPSRLGHVNAALKFYEDTDVCVFFQMVEDTATTEDALEILLSDLSEVGIQLREVIFQKVWSYFPHVRSEALEDGFYDKLESLQGTRGTYYAGSLLSFETVEHTAAYAQDLIERFF